MLEQPIRRLIRCLFKVVFSIDIEMTNTWVDDEFLGSLEQFIGCDAGQMDWDSKMSFIEQTGHCSALGIDTV